MLTRSKYKSVSPADTISKIKFILSLLGIEVQSKIITNDNLNYSCRLQICSYGLDKFNIGSNGKGMSEDYALASAYAELLERLQNKALISGNLRYATRCFLSYNNYSFSNLPTLDFFYFPDETERWLTLSELEHEIIPRYFPLCNCNSLDKNAQYPCIFAPFKELVTNRTQMIPVEYYRAMCGTTGLCAGNNREEAIIQGINEIFERYVLMKIFTTHLELPQVNLSIFEGHEIYNRIKELERKYTIVIKDCSLGIGIPVLGLLLIDQNNGTYAFRLGADFNIITALERCYTESFQGENAEKYIFNQYDAENPIDYKQYKKALKNGRGRFPHCILDDNLSKPQFPHHDFSSYKEELHYYINLISSLGTNLYVKDNSFLGFPAYAVYIPNFSIKREPLFCFSEMVDKKRLTYGKKDPLLNIIESFGTDSSEMLLKNLEDDVAILQKWNTSKSAQINSLILEMYVYVANKDYQQAKIRIKKLSQKYNLPVGLRCAYDLLTYLENGKDLTIVRKIYGSTMVNTFLEQFQNVKKFINFQSFPRCFQCDTCPIVDTCNFKDILEFERMIQDKQKMHEIYSEG